MNPIDLGRATAPAVSDIASKFMLGWNGYSKVRP